MIEFKEYFTRSFRTELQCILQEYGEDWPHSDVETFRFTCDALIALKEASWEFLIQIFKDAQLVADFSKKNMVTKKEIRIAFRALPVTKSFH
jgi:histone H3/H4